MKKTLKLFAIMGLLIITASQANAGIISKFRGWGSNFWNNRGYGHGGYHRGYNNGCPCHNNGYAQGFHNGRHHGNRFFNNGSVTGFTPPINGGFFPSFGNYHSPIYAPNQYPYGQINSFPQQMITDFNSNVGTRTGVTILD